MKCFPELLDENNYLKFSIVQIPRPLAQTLWSQNLPESGLGSHLRLFFPSGTFGKESLSCRNWQQLFRLGGWTVVREHSHPPIPDQMLTQQRLPAGSRLHYYCLVLPSKSLVTKDAHTLMVPQPPTLSLAVKFQREIALNRLYLFEIFFSFFLNSKDKLTNL